MTLKSKVLHGYSCGEFRGYDVDINLHMTHERIVTIDTEIARSDDSLLSLLEHFLDKDDFFGNSSPESVCPELDTLRIKDVCIARGSRDTSYIYSYEQRLIEGSSPPKAAGLYRINIVAGRNRVQYMNPTPKSEPSPPRAWKMGP